MRGIVFTDESVIGIDSGIKTQTRRLGTPRYNPGERLYVKEAWRSWTLNNCHKHYEDADGDDGCDPHCNQTYVAYRATPRVGFRPVPDKARICYLDESSPLEQNQELLGPWKNSMFMPEWAARFRVVIAEVRVQRIWDITDDDARDEGVEPHMPPHGHISPDQRVPGPGFDDARLGDRPHRLSFADRWDEINGRRRRREHLQLGDPGYTVDRPWRTVVDESARWEANPEVTAYTFAVERVR